MKRRWPLRLIQLAPVLLLLIGVALWFSVPSDSRSLAFEPQPSPATTSKVAPFSTPDPTVTAQEAVLVEREARARKGTVTLNSQSGLAEAMWFSAAQLVQAGSAIGTAGIGFRPEAYPPTDPVFDAVNEYERKTGSRIAVAIVPGVKNPPVVMSSIADSSALTPAERAEFASRGTIEALRRAVRGGLAPTPDGPGDTATASPLPITVPDGGFSGNQLEGRGAGFGTLALNGRVYEIYSVSTIKDADGSDTPGDITQWTEFETPQHRQAMDESAKREKGAIFIVGPVDAPPVLERTPAGMTAASALRYISMSRTAAVTGYLFDGPYRLSGPMAEAVGRSATWGEAALVSPGPPSISSTNPVPAIYFASVSAVNPMRAHYAELIGHGLSDNLRVWLGGNLQPLLGALVALFVLSLIASPLAFAYERQRLEQLDLERERERVQRETRQRVLGRLTELSARMDSAAANAASGERDTIGGLAADIDSTVSDLKRILQDVPLITGGDHD